MNNKTIMEDTLNDERVEMKLNIEPTPSGKRGLGQEGAMPSWLGGGRGPEQVKIERTMSEIFGRKMVLEDVNNLSGKDAEIAIDALKSIKQNIKPVNLIKDPNFYKREAHLFQEKTQMSNEAFNALKNGKSMADMTIAEQHDFYDKLRKLEGNTSIAYKMRTIAIILNVLLFGFVVVLVIRKGFPNLDEGFYVTLFLLLLVTPFFSLISLILLKKEGLRFFPHKFTTNTMRIMVLWVTISMLTIIFLFPPTGTPGRRLGRGKVPFLNIPVLLQRVAPIILIGGGLYIMLSGRKQK